MDVVAGAEQLMCLLWLQKRFLPVDVCCRGLCKHFSDEFVGSVVYFRSN